MLNISKNANLDNSNVEWSAMAFTNITTMNHNEPILPPIDNHHTDGRQWHTNQHIASIGGWVTGSVGVGRTNTKYHIKDMGTEH